MKLLLSSVFALALMTSPLIIMSMFAKGAIASPPPGMPAPGAPSGGTSSTGNR